MSSFRRPGSMPGEAACGDVIETVTAPGAWAIRSLRGFAGFAIVLLAGGPAAAADAIGPLGLSSLEWAFTEALALIALACLFVPMAKGLGLGSVIGYLVAGVAAGAVLRLSYAEHPEELLHFAEFGVVLFLFVIGLEFRPRRLWQMRGTIFGRGLVQVLACAALLGGAAYAFGLDWRAATIVGLGLALSSTALVMREIDEGGERRTPFGETAIAVLLFEDLAIVPLLLLVALVAPGGGEASLADNLRAMALGLVAIGVLIAVGRYGLNPMFWIVARTRTPELMTAAALGVVIFASFVMTLAGLSYAMGAFIAGMMLADSAFRHEVEADIEPFRALFLGLFFVAVGLSLDLRAVAENWLLILVAVPILILLKGSPSISSALPSVRRGTSPCGSHSPWRSTASSASSSSPRGRRRSSSTPRRPRWPSPSSPCR